MIKVTELRVGNWFMGFNNKPIKWTLQDFYFLSTGIDIDEIIKKPIELTEEILLKCGFDKMPEFTVMSALTFNLGRDRSLSIGSVGTPNEMLFIREGKGSIKDDIVVLHNFDYDGKLHLHTLQNICSLLGKELEIDLS